MADPLPTILTERLGCRLPVIQTAMGWIATPALVAASSNAGAFGFLAGAVMKPAELADAVARLKDMTPHNFGVNFHSFQPGAAEIVEIILAAFCCFQQIVFGFQIVDQNLIVLLGRRARDHRSRQFAARRFDIHNLAGIGADNRGPVQVIKPLAGRRAQTLGAPVFLGHGCPFTFALMTG